MRTIVRAGWRFSIDLIKMYNFFALANLLLLNYGIEGSKKGAFFVRYMSVFHILGGTCKFLPPPWYKEVNGPTPLRVFDMFHYFGTILPSVESL